LNEIRAAGNCERREMDNIAGRSLTRAILDSRTGWPVDEGT